MYIPVHSSLTDCSIVGSVLNLLYYKCDKTYLYGNDDTRKMHCRRYIGRLDGKFRGIIFVMSSKCEQQATLRK